MKKSLFSTATFLVSFAAFGIILGSSCKKDPDGGSTLSGTCKPEIVISEFSFDGAPADRDTAFLFYADDDGDGFQDADEYTTIQQVYSDADNHTDYTWQTDKVTIEWWLSGSLFISTVHTLDAVGRSVEEIQTNVWNNGSTSTTLRTYDTEGRIAQTTSFDNLAETTVSTYEWESGNLKRMVSVSGNGTSTAVYEYYPDLANTLSTNILPIFGKESALLVKSGVSSSGGTSAYSYLLDEKGRIKTQTTEHVSPTTSLKIASEYFYACQ
ncbi:MAG: hypothetical protein ACKVUS_08175 [Saprospiraceae bacterium]